MAIVRGSGIVGGTLLEGQNVSLDTSNFDQNLSPSENTVQEALDVLDDLGLNVPHKVSHENGGVDEISVAGLSGVLADAQTPINHASTHEVGGADEIASMATRSFFVWRPGMVATREGNVYSSLSDIAAACAVLEGIKTVQIDNSITASPSIASSLDFGSNTILSGQPGAVSSMTLNITNGVQLSGIIIVTGNIQIALSPGATPLFILDDQSITFESRASLFTLGAPAFQIPDGKTGNIDLRFQALLNAVGPGSLVAVGDSSTLALTIEGDSSFASNKVTGLATSTIILDVNNASGNLPTFSGFPGLLFSQLSARSEVVSYDNTTSGLSASNVKDAIDELDSNHETHATRHENGGADEIDVGGLSGVLADPQVPAAHVTTHELGGTDQIDLSGLDVDAVDVVVDTTNFDTNLSAADSDLQTALETVDELLPNMEQWMVMIHVFS